MLCTVFEAYPTRVILISLLKASISMQITRKLFYSASSLADEYFLWIRVASGEWWIAKLERWVLSTECNLFRFSKAFSIRNTWTSCIDKFCSYPARIKVEIKYSTWIGKLFQQLTCEMEEKLENAGTKVRKLKYQKNQVCLRFQLSLDLRYRI